MKAYQIAIQLQGKVESSVNASFLSAAGSMSRLTATVNNLNSAQNKIAGYQKQRSSLKSIIQQYRESQAEAKKLGSVYAQNDSKLKSLRSTKAKTQELKDEIKKLSAVVSTNKKEFNAAQDASQKLRDKFHSQHQALKPLRAELKSAGVDTKNMAKAQDLLAKSAQRATGAQNRLRNAQASLAATKQRLSFSSLQAEVAPILAFGGALYTTVKAAAELETTMAGIRKVVDFESPEAFKQTQKDLQALSLQIPMTTAQLGDIYQAGGQGGIAKNDLLGFTEQAAKMGVAFDVSAEQAGDWMAKWRAGLKMSQSEVVELADQINYLGNKTSASAAEISAVVTRIGPLGKVGNVAGKQIAALGATIVGAGRSEEVAATGIKNLMLALTSGAAATKLQRDAFAQLRLDPEMVAKEMMQDPEKVISGVLERIAKAPGYQQTGIMKQIFGSESIAAIAPLLSNVEEFKKNLSLTKGGYTGSMEAEFKSMSSTAANSLQLMRNAADVTKQNLGTSLLPVVKNLSESAVEMSQSFGKFAEKHPDLIAGTVKFAAAIATLKIASVGLRFTKDVTVLPFKEGWVACEALRASYIAADGNLIQMIRNTKVYTVAAKAAGLAQRLWNNALLAGKWLLDAAKLIAYKAATFAVSLATKAWAGIQWLLNAALSANPIGLVVVGITALVGAVIWAYNKFEGFRNIVLSAWDALKNVGGSIKAFFTGETSTSAGSAANIARHSAGGVFTSPHIGMVAEAGVPESVIPWNSGGRNIWEKTGERNNWNQASTFAPSVIINIDGRGQDSTSIARQVSSEVKRVLSDLKRQNERVSFA